MKIIMMKISTPFIALVLLFLLGESPINPCLSQSNQLTTKFTNHVGLNEKRQQQIDSLLQLFHQYGQFNGSALVANAGEVIYKKGFGSANREWGIANTPDTKFRLASVTKQFTAMVIVQLAAEGKLDLQAPISIYLPDYPQKAADQITIHHLLTHTSGIPNYTSFPSYYENMAVAKSPEELVEMFADSTLSFTPGERFSYSNSGYTLLGIIAEKMTNKSLAKVVEMQILEPLGMKNTGFDDYKKVLEKRAMGYEKFGLSYKNSTFIDMSVAYAAGGLYSTVEDLHLWDQALYTDKLLPKKYRELIFQPHIPAWGGAYGYGWSVSKHRKGNSDEKVETIDHDGVINGFRSLILRIPSSQSSIILLANSQGANLYRIADAIIGILYDKSYDFPKKARAIVLAENIRDSGLEKAMINYKKTIESDEYYDDESEMNFVGYDLLEKGLWKEAEAVFLLNVQEHPHSSNVYDSYGEILLKQGNTEDAIVNYKKSMAYNPQNENGRMVLHKLGITDSEIDKLTMELLDSDKEWKHEIFHFPIHFAKSIPYEGREDARFPAGWRDEKSGDFWSYVIAWYVDAKKSASMEEVMENINKYYDGLMEVVNKDEGKVLPKTKSAFTLVNTKDGTQYYEGVIDIYDSFVTRDEMKLHVKLERKYCEAEQKSAWVFWISPKSYDHAIWQKMKGVQLRKEICIE